MGLTVIGIMVFIGCPIFLVCGVIVGLTLRRKRREARGFDVLPDASLSKGK